MSTLDDAVKKHTRKIPLLRNEGFVKKFPKVVEVACYMRETSQASEKLFGSYAPFDKLGIRNVDQYLALLDRGNPQARKIYNNVRSMLETPTSE